MGRGRSKTGSQGGSRRRRRRVTPLKVIDVWSYRHRKNNEPFVDDINTAARTLEESFPGMMEDVETVNAVKLNKRNNGILGYYTLDGTVNMNLAYTDPEEMNVTMDACAKSGYHPSRGNKSGTEAVALHELGHALTTTVAKRMGIDGVFALDEAADRIVANARKSAGKIAGRGGVQQFRSQISGYASESNAEAVAEAVTDYYCNGRNASTASKAIMAELFKYR